MPLGLLLINKNVLETLDEYTFLKQQVLIPSALLDFKFANLKTKGYRINDLQFTKSHFLKENLGVYGGNNSHDC